MHIGLHRKHIHQIDNAWIEAGKEVLPLRMTLGQSIVNAALKGLIPDYD